MPRIDDYKKAFEIAKGELEKVNPKRIADQSGASIIYDKEGNVRLRIVFLNREVELEWTSFGFSFVDGKEEIPIQQQVLILHYLMGCPGSKVEGQWVAYQEIPDGRFYMDAFVRRAKEPLVKTFGGNPEALVTVAQELYAAKPFDHGDISVVVQALPKIPVALILWKGDDEFPPEGSILFDRSIQEILSAEDIAWLAGMVVYPLVGRAAKKVLSAHG
ncbi:MAG: DUF3786 domain-containing protein [Deltaproteobacteria bacterium]|nr:DUF3786 domain-containing protein [Deltaproteobacteria bacterium]MBW1928754.1 DUF3786 domain-containing protein [Deltaproteobacteria bacterium]MBW2025005.1 DUF3786 domain-containing protein [Deltaproteobacteria bacterium]MBW2124126.1 DUF3786 domain-containing protein [Deltaproteobacteria bacterium]